MSSLFFLLYHKKVKLPEGSTLHVLRHTHAHSLLKAGFSLIAIQYSSIAITADLYGHIDAGFHEVEKNHLLHVDYIFALDLCSKKASEVENPQKPYVI